MQRVELLLQLDQVQLVHQALDQLLARPLLPVHEALHQLVLAQELGHAPQAVLHPARGFLAFGHRYGRRTSAAGPAGFTGATFRVYISAHMLTAMCPWSCRASLTRKLRQAEERLRSGDAAGAESLCEEVLRQAPRNPGRALLARPDAPRHGPDAGRGAAARAGPLRSACVTAFALEHLGLAHLMLGQFAEAESVLRDAAALPGAPGFGVHAARCRDAPPGQATPRRSLPCGARSRSIRKSAECQLNLGQALARMGDPAAARDAFRGRAAPRTRSRRRAVQSRRDLSRPERTGRRTAMVRACARAARRGTSMPWSTSASCCRGSQRLDDAAACLRKALALDPANASGGQQPRAHAGVAGQAGAGAGAVPCRAADRPGFRRRARRPRLRLPRARPGGRGDQPSESDAARPSPTIATPCRRWRGRCSKPANWTRPKRPPSASAHWTHPPPRLRATLANVYIVRGELDRAIATLESGYAQTGAGSLLGMLTYQLRQACDWTKWRVAWDEMAPGIERERGARQPVLAVVRAHHRRQQLAYTRRWAESRFGSIAPAARGAGVAPRRHPRLRIGYLSSDLQEHAAAYLIADVLELHDRERFEVFAYSHGPDDHEPDAPAAARGVRAFHRHRLGAGRRRRRTHTGGRARHPGRSQGLHGGRPADHHGAPSLRGAGHLAGLPGHHGRRLHRLPDRRRLHHPPGTGVGVLGAHRAPAALLPAERSQARGGRAVARAGLWHPGSRVRILLLQPDLQDHARRLRRLDAAAARRAGQRAVARREQPLGEAQSHSRLRGRTAWPRNDWFSRRACPTRSISRATASRISRSTRFPIPRTRP